MRSIENECFVRTSTASSHSAMSSAVVAAAQFKSLCCDFHSSVRKRQNSVKLTVWEQISWGCWVGDRRLGCDLGRRSTQRRQIDAHAKQSRVRNTRTHARTGTYSNRQLAHHQGRPSITVRDIQSSPRANQSTKRRQLATRCAQQEGSERA